MILAGSMALGLSVGWLELPVWKEAAGGCELGKMKTYLQGLGLSITHPLGEAFIVCLCVPDSLWVVRPVTHHWVDLHGFGLLGATHSSGGTYQLTEYRMLWMLVGSVSALKIKLDQEIVLRGTGMGLLSGGKGCTLYHLSLTSSLGSVVHKHLVSAEATGRKTKWVSKELILLPIN
jgi:hypothetical protein